MNLMDTQTLEEGPAPGLRQRKREQRLVQILESSRQVFVTHGYAGYSMRKVAEHAGVHLNTVQHFFGDVDNLIVSTLEDVISGYTTRFKEIAAETELSARDRLEAIIDLNLRDTGNPEILAVFNESWAAASHSKSIADLQTRLYAEYEDILTSLILEMAPGRSATECRLDARLIAAWMEGFALISQFTPDSPLFGPAAARMKARCLSLFGTI